MSLKPQGRREAFFRIHWRNTGKQHGWVLGFYHPRVSTDQVFFRFYRWGRSGGTFSVRVPLGKKANIYKNEHDDFISISPVPRTMLSPRSLQLILNKIMNNSPYLIAPQANGHFENDWHKLSGEESHSRQNSQSKYSCQTHPTPASENIIWKHKKKPSLQKASLSLPGLVGRAYPWQG